MKVICHKPKRPTNHPNVLGREETFTKKVQKHWGKRIDLVSLDKMFPPSHF